MKIKAYKRKHCQEDEKNMNPEKRVHTGHTTTLPDPRKRHSEPAAPGYPGEPREFFRSLNFALLDGLFQGIRNQPVKPFVTEGIFCPDDGLQRQFKLIPAGFTYRYGAAVKKAAIRKGLVNDLPAHITIHLLHDILLMGNLHMNKIILHFSRNVEM
jgi:hypothetical protein